MAKQQKAKVAVTTNATSKIRKEGKAVTQPSRRGRRAIKENNSIDKAVIIRQALKLVKTTPLQELSVLRVARELNVAPGLIHYYLDGRNGLTSGVMNAFYREVLSEWPPSKGEWRNDVEAIFRRVYEGYVSYPGVAAYVVSNNRYRLKQLLDEGEEDYGLLLFERVVAVVCEVKYDSLHTALYAHLLMEFVASMAFSAVRHRFPEEHTQYLEDIFENLDPEKFPATHFVSKDFVKLNSKRAFDEGLRLLLDAIEDNS